jgi:hypothetical protein
MWYALTLTGILGLNYFGVVYDESLTRKIIIDILTGMYYTIMAVIVVLKYDSWKQYFRKNFDDIDDWAQAWERDKEKKQTMEMETTMKKQLVA